MARRVDFVDFLDFRNWTNSKRGDEMARQHVASN
jgi:hypothetical protein